MKITNEQEYKIAEEKIERLIQKGTELGDMELLSETEKAEFTALSDALDEYGLKKYPLPGQITPYLAQTIRKRVKEIGLKQTEAAGMIGVSTSMMRDLLHGRRTMNFEIARNLYKKLGVPAEVVLG